MIKRATTCTKHQNRSPPHVCLAASVSKMDEKNTCNSPSSCSKLAIQSRKQIWEPFTHFTTESEHTKAMEDTTKTGKKRQRMDKANRAAKQFLLTSLRDLCKSSDAAELKKNLGRIASSADKSTIIQTTYFVLSILRKQLEEFWQGLESKQGQKPGRVEETPTDGRTLLSILRRKNPDLGKNGKMPPSVVAAISYIQPQVKAVKSSKKKFNGTLQEKKKKKITEVLQEQKKMAMQSIRDSVATKATRANKLTFENPKIAKMLWECKMREDWSKTYPDDWKHWKEFQDKIDCLYTQEFRGQCKLKWFRQSMWEAFKQFEEETFALFAETSEPLEKTQKTTHATETEMEEDARRKQTIISLHESATTFMMEEATRPFRFGNEQSRIILRNMLRQWQNNQESNQEDKDTLCLQDMGHFMTEIRLLWKELQERSMIPTWISKQTVHGEESDNSSEREIL